MKTIIAATAVIASLAGASSAFAIEPIQGSITYGGHVAQLSKAPVGSTVLHSFNAGGSDFREVYRVSADRTLDLVSRSVAND
ncbi:hypothetical protein J5J10_05775 [Ciceribacter sp. L1K23]|uniref:hypothetical protein n=1 Tax=Ciceribacter sp. L1K23 TaxID=2820276 RepID=UPI001B8395F6|nr:hypothetical protein [Ciceribacter sp. L1K23]MBR0555186.1 hypothetical protein [Ciceribacter sp. L1K23]